MNTVMQQYSDVVRNQTDEFPQIWKGWKGTTNKDYFGQRVLQAHVPEHVVPQFHGDLCDVLRDELGWNPKSPRRSHRIDPIEEVRVAADFSNHPRMIYEIASPSDGKKE